jgi:hypothetical protein
MPTGRSKHTTEEQQCGAANMERQVVTPSLQLRKTGTIMADTYLACTLEIGCRHAGWLLGQAWVADLEGSLCTAGLFMLRSNFACHRFVAMHVIVSTVGCG